jgi:hypothetical protein
MSFFFGSGGKKVKPQYTGLATQTSTSNIPVAILMGKSRVAPNIVFQGDFKAHKQKQKAGKGFGGSTVSYTYSGTYQLALGWGPAIAITKVWKDQSKETDYTKLGFSVQLGTIPQSPWGYMVTAHPSEALGYSGIIMMNVANYDLGSTNTLGQHSFEGEWHLYNTQVGGNGDADCALAIEEFLTNEIYGVPIDLSILSNLLSTGAATTTGDDAYQTYCRAIGFGLSPTLISQEAANNVLDRWTKITNTATVWTGYSLKLVPYADETITANGVTYLPNFPIRYTITDKDFLRADDEDPITFDRVDPADAYNSVIITIKNRQNEYNDLPVEWRDQGLVDQYGLRSGNSVDCPEVCEPDMAARMVALMGQRVGYVRNTYNFKLPVRYCLLEPMDVLECVDPKLGTFTVIVREITEDEDDNLTFVAEEYQSSITQSGITEPAPTSNDPVNTGVTASDVNTPIILQPPPSLTSNAPQIWAAVSGGNPIDTTDDPLWGGCEVWISTDGGTSYKMVGTIDAPARMGKLSAALAAYGGANPDTVHTLKVNFAMSGAVFSDSATPTDAAAGVTVGYIAAEGANVEEFISYETPTLNSPDVYWFTNLYRGLNGSVAGAHAINARYARLDTEAIFKYNFPLELMGQTIYVKFVSFNIWNSGYQDISTVTPYSFTISSAYTYGTDLADLGDVDLSTPPTDGQNLEWDNTLGKWVAVSPLYGFSWLRVPVATKILAVFDSPTSWKLPTGLTNSQGTIVNSDTSTATAPSLQTDFDIQSPFGTSIGTMRFAASSLTATFINATPDSITLGTPVYIIAPSNLNGMAGAITGSIRGTRP